MGSVVTRRPDLIGVLEALYAQGVDDQAWYPNALRAIEATLDGDSGMYFGLLAHQDDYSQPTVLDLAVSPRISMSMAWSTDAMRQVPQPLLRATWYPGRPVVGHRELEGTLPTEAQAWFRHGRERLSWHDGFAVFAYPAPGLAALAAGGLSPGQALTRRDAHVLGQIGAHVHSALRLRLQPSSAVAAVLAPDGKVRDLADRSLTRQRREWFGSRVTQIETARRDRKEGRIDLEPWWALFAGKYSIVPLEDSDGKRHYLLVTNAPHAEDHARFTIGEIDVVRAAARGLTNKSIAYQLGVNPSVVSDRLATAASKVGLRSRHDLVRVCASLFGVSSTTLDVQQLTLAEQDILALLRRGMSNAQIAQLRARSQNTVKNQIASMLRKTGAPSRRALALSKPPS